jgi:hypothetical protein
MQETTACATANWSTHSETRDQSQAIPPPSQPTDALLTNSGASIQRGPSSASLLARLEAENTMLRDRAVELALHIQRLAQQPR